MDYLCAALHLMRYTWPFITLTLPVIAAFTLMPPGNWLAYKTKDYFVQYPMNWKLDKSGTLGTRFILYSPKDTTGTRAYISLTSQAETGGDISADSMLRLNESQLPMAIEDFKLLSKEVITVNKRRCFRIIYTGKQGGRDLKWMQQGCIVSGQFYAITYTASLKHFEKYKEVATAIFNTLQFY